MSIRRSLGWSVGQQIGMYLLQFINMVVIARLLTPAEVGVFVLALSVSLFLQSLREMGLTNYLIQVKDLTDHKLRTVFGLSVLVASVIAVAVLLLRVPIADALNAPGAAQVLVLVAIMVLLFPLEHPAQALLRREMRFDLLLQTALAAKFCGVVTSIGLAWAGWSYMALGWGMLVEAAVRALLIVMIERRHLRAGISLSNASEVFNFSLWSTGSSLSASAVPMVEKMLVSAFLGVSVTGLYDRAQQIPTMLRMGLIMTLGRVFVPAFAAEVREGRPVGHQVEMISAVTMGVLWPVYLLIGLLASPLVLILFGETWIDVAGILPWVLAAHAINSILLPPDQVLIPYGAVVRLFVIRVLQLFLAVAIVSIGVSAGLNAFLLCLVIAATVVLMITWVAIRNHAMARWTILVQYIGQSAAVALFTALPVAVVSIGFPELSPIAKLGPLVATPFLWVAALYLTAHPLFNELTRAMRWMARFRTS